MVDVDDLVSLKVALVAKVEVGVPLVTVIRVVGSSDVVEVAVPVAVFEAEV